MEITASLVKELRQRTGAGMMECKKALAANDANIDAAAEWLRKSGLAKADKKADRITAEGCLAIAQSEHSAVLLEINSETDFVAKDQTLISFAQAVADLALAKKITDIASLKDTVLANGETVEQTRAGVIAKVGENIQLRRIAYLESEYTIAGYLHGKRIGVIVTLQGGSSDLAKGIAMHIAAMNPPYIKPTDVPASYIEKEKEIALARMSEADQKKPKDILEKILNGLVQKIIDDVTLYRQAYVLNTNQTVEKALKEAHAEVISFQRFVVGEGIEKVTEDYAAEVMKQAGLA